MSALEIPGGTEGLPEAAVDSAVRPAFTPKRRSKRPRRDVETTGKRGFIAAARRFIRAAGRRAGEGDEHELRELLAPRTDLDEAIADAIAGQRTYGKSWADIARATGTTREAAYQKWNRK